MKFVPDKKLVIGHSGNEPPRWVMVLVGGIIGCVVLVFMFDQQEPASWLRSSVPYADSNWFWVGLIVLPLVALGLVAVLRTVVETRQAASWTSTAGRVVRSEIESRRHQFQGEPEKVENVPAVEYEFEARGRTVRGRRISIGDDSGGENTEATLARYPVGAAVTVYYDPDDPKNSALERDGLKSVPVFGCLVALAMLALAVAGVYAMAAYGPDFVRAYFPKAGNAEFAVAMTGFGLLALLFFLGIRRMALQAMGWPTVRGQVVRSEVETFRKTEKGGRTTTSHRPVVEYVYPVRGREYRGNQITLMVQVSGSEMFAQKIRARYPAGAAVTVRYDPANPGNAALEISGGASWLPLVIAAVSFALAAWQLGLFW